VRFEDSVRPRHGRRFEPTHELRVGKDVESLAGKLPGARSGVLVIREMTGPFGVPDFTAVVGGARALERRLALDVPALLNEIDAAVVSVLTPRRPKTIVEIENSIPWSQESVARRLPRLLRVGAVIQLRPGAYTRPSDLQSIGTIWALEVKVNNWRKAISQARTYSIWADGYVVILGPVGGPVIAKVLEEAALDQSGVVIDGVWFRKPHVQRQSRMRHLWASEHVIAALRHHYQPSPLP